MIEACVSAKAAIRTLVNVFGLLLGSQAPNDNFTFRISPCFSASVITGWLLFLSGGFCGQRHGYWAGSGSDVYFFAVIDECTICMLMYVGMFPKPLFQCSCRAPWGPADSGHVFGCTLTGATRRRFSAPKAGDLDTSWIALQCGSSMKTQDQIQSTSINNDAASMMHDNLCSVQTLFSLCWQGALTWLCCLEGARVCGEQKHASLRGFSPWEDFGAKVWWCWSSGRSLRILRFVFYSESIDSCHTWKQIKTNKQTTVEHDRSFETPSGNASQRGAFSQQLSSII